jgi:hypothetical protein
LGLLRWLKGLVKPNEDDESPLPEGGIDALRADQQATLTYGIPPEQAERMSRRDAEELERAEAEDE